MPIVGVRFELSGTQASALEFEIEAFFLGSNAVRMAGKRLQASGPTGREPLVGLKVGLRRLAKGDEAAPAAPMNAAVQGSNRVRIFRSRSA